MAAVSSIKSQSLKTPFLKTSFLKTLSVVIPTLNEADSIVHTLLPLQRWRKDFLEIILCDAGSTDNTLNLAQPLCDRIEQTAPGRALQMNAGAARACGEFILFLHADTQLPETLNTLVTVWQQENTCWGFFPVRLTGRHPLLRMVETSMNWRSRLTSVATGDQCLFMTRKLFQQQGGFDEIPLMEDIALSKRLRRVHKPRVEGVAVMTSSRRWEAKGIVRTIVFMWRLRLAYFMGASPHDLVKLYYPNDQARRKITSR